MVEELLAALVHQPEDLASWSVLADALQTRSDPRGELISMMLRREQQPTPRLFDAQRRYLMKRELAPEQHAVLRRGFVTEYRIESAEQLVLLAEPTLRFVDAVTLAIDGEDWDAWATALAERTWSWRSLVVELENPPEQLALATVFAACPAIELARLQFPEDEAVELVWDGVRAPELRRLVMVNAGRIADLDAEFPALRELWIIGQSAVEERVLARWEGLERVVLSDGELDDRPANVSSYRERDPDEYEATAFALVGQPIEPALIQKFVAKMTGVSRLSVRIAELWWLRRPVTLISLHGDQDPSLLLPYSLAIALENIVSPAPPIVLVEIDDSRGHFLALGPHPVRDSVVSTTTQLVRHAFDVTFGCDPGSTIVADVLDAIATAPEHVLVGIAGGAMLNMIDPQATPLGDPNADEYDDSYDEDEEDEDEYYSDSDDDDQEAQLEEPIPLAKIIVKTEADARIELYGDVEVEDDDEVVDEEVVYATDEVLDRPEAWFEFRENWEDRATAADDEEGDVRWPDPEHADELRLDTERQLAVPACLEHGELDTCSQCSAPVCWECVETPVAGVCSVCVKELDQQPPASTAEHPRARPVLI